MSANTDSLLTKSTTKLLEGYDMVESLEITPNSNESEPAEEVCHEESRDDDQNYAAEVAPVGQELKRNDSESSIDVIEENVFQNTSSTHEMIECVVPSPNLESSKVEPCSKQSVDIPEPSSTPSAQIQEPSVEIPEPSSTPSAEIQEQSVEIAEPSSTPSAEMQGPTVEIPEPSSKPIDEIPEPIEEIPEPIEEIPEPNVKTIPKRKIVPKLAYQYKYIVKDFIIVYLVTCLCFTACLHWCLGKCNSCDTNSNNDVVAVLLKVQTNLMACIGEQHTLRQRGDYNASMSCMNVDNKYRKTIDKELTDKECKSLLSVAQKWIHLNTEPLPPVFKEIPDEVNFHFIIEQLELLKILPQHEMLYDVTKKSDQPENVTDPILDETVVLAKLDQTIYTLASLTNDLYAFRKQETDSSVLVAARSAILEKIASLQRILDNYLVPALKSQKYGLLKYVMMYENFVKAVVRMIFNIVLALWGFVVFIIKKLFFFVPFY